MSTVAVWWQQVDASRNEVDASEAKLKDIKKEIKDLEAKKNPMEETIDKIEKAKEDAWEKYQKALAESKADPKNAEKLKARKLAQANYEMLFDRWDKLTSWMFDLSSRLHELRMRLFEIERATWKAMQTTRLLQYQAISMDTLYFEMSTAVMGDPLDKEGTPELKDDDVLMAVLKEYPFLREVFQKKTQQAHVG